MIAPPAATPTRRRAATDRGARWWSTAVAVLFWIVVPLFCLVSLGFGIERIVGHVVVVPSGLRGTYEVTNHSCSGPLCISTGTFTSTDGTVIVPGLLGDYRWQPGRSYKVLYSANSVEVTPLPRWDPSPTLLGLAGSIGYLAIWGWFFTRRRRRPRSGAGAADPRTVGSVPVADPP
jgi:hypothetical protein